MKEEFKRIYDYIINSEDEEKMKVLGNVTKSMMMRFIENYPQQAREYLDKLQSVKWHNYVTAKEADAVVSQMDPKPMMLPKSTWSRAIWEETMQNLGLPKNDEPFYNEDALYLTMAMIYSDSGETLKDLLHIEDTKAPSETLFRAIYHLALNRLKDKDKVFNIRNYFGL